MIRAARRVLASSVSLGGFFDLVGDFMGGDGLRLHLSFMPKVLMFRHSGPNVSRRRSFDFRDDIAGFDVTAGELTGVDFEGIAGGAVGVMKIGGFGLHSLDVEDGAAAVQEGNVERDQRVDHPEPELLILGKDEEHSCVGFKRGPEHQPALMGLRGGCEFDGERVIADGEPAEWQAGWAEITRLTGRVVQSAGASEGCTSDEQGGSSDRDSNGGEGGNKARPAAGSYIPSAHDLPLHVTFVL